MYKIDREKMISLMKNKIEEGYEVVENLNIKEKDCVTTIINIFELERTINDLMAKDQYDKEMENKEITDALAKNEEVEVEC